MYNIKVCYLDRNTLFLNWNAISREKTKISLAV